MRNKQEKLRVNKTYPYLKKKKKYLKKKKKKKKLFKE